MKSKCILTDRELKIAQFKADGFSYKEMAREMGSTKYAVANAAYRLIHRLGFRDFHSVVIWAWSNELIK